MARAKKTPNNAEIIRRLTTVKVMIAGMGDAMPHMARELRREARETLDDVIGELA